MEDYTFLHRTNIIIHVTIGSIALLLGLIIILQKKGGDKHRKMGKWFLILLSLVILTALLGFFAFNANQFLLVLTLVAGYNGYSGFRTLQTKSNTPELMDILVALATLYSGIFFLYYIESIGMIWAPIIIYSTMGYLFLIIGYDLLRYLIPKNKYGNLWFYEHIYKMISAFTALTAAAAGNILPDYKPYSQFLPSVLGTFLAIGFILYFYRKQSIQRKRVLPTLKVEKFGTKKSAGRFQKDQSIRSSHYGPSNNR